MEKRAESVSTGGRRRLRALWGVVPLLVALGWRGERAQAQAPVTNPSSRGEVSPTPVTHRAPARDYTLFEADPVRPLAVLPSSGLLATLNTAADRLELVRRQGSTLSVCGSIAVGMRPVAVSVVADGPQASEVWVSNHLSDSVSRVRVDTAGCSGEVIDTLQVGDEPRDLVVADVRGETRVFVATAHRGQHHARAGARTGRDLVLPAGDPDKEAPGLGDVFVFRAAQGSRPVELLSVVNLFTEPARALAVGAGTVFAAGFRTGNRTTVVPAEEAEARAVASVKDAVALDAAGRPIVDARGEFRLKPEVIGVTAVAGGMPAVAGQGRCLPDIRPEHADRTLAQLCAQTDAQHHLLKLFEERPGVVNAACQCTSADGTLQPTTSVIVKFFDSQTTCGANFKTFPDGSSGCWLDADPAGVRTPARKSSPAQAPMAWNDSVAFSLPDQDVFAIDADSLAVTEHFSGVGTVLFNLAVDPVSGAVFASNTDAQNLTRFEGAGLGARSTVRGHLHESRLTRLAPRADRGRVLPIHLNTHVDYSRCCTKDEQENARSLAFPTGLAFTADGQFLFTTALGSDKLVRLRTSALTAAFDNVSARSRGDLLDVSLSADLDNPTGPVGLLIDETRRALYVKTHFSNEVVSFDLGRARSGVLSPEARVTLPSPEPLSITRGRSVLYNARTTSSHGDSACGSCHVFGDFDGLTWDLGDPDGVTVTNPGPFATAPTASGRVAAVNDPFSDGAPRDTNVDFRSNKGPMSTQTLRGMANHGAQHWRGDRTRRAQNTLPAQPDTGSLDEVSSFGEFDVAIAGLNGNDIDLPPARFAEFTDFALQLTLPPNPVRALDNSLSPAQSSARATYFGCESVSDAQFEQGRCNVRTAAGIQEVDIDDETATCECAGNPVAEVLRGTSSVLEFVEAMQARLSNAGARAQVQRLLLQAATQSSNPAQSLVQSQTLWREVQAVLGLRDQRDQRGLLVEDGAELLFNFARAALAFTDGVDDAAAQAVLTALVADWDRGRGTLQSTSGGWAMARLEQLIRMSPDGVLGDDDLERWRSREAQSVAARGRGEEPAAVDSNRSVLVRVLAVARLTLEVLADDQRAGSVAFRGLLGACSVSAAAECRLRLTDNTNTCHGCHTLDPHGNEGFGVFRPGFFGTSGKYTFEALSQIAKVPHLRNAYQKTGMFDTVSNLTQVPSSVLGLRRGGFSGTQTVFQGPQVRGSGFLHDGAIGSVVHFFAGIAFARTPRVPLESPGNPGGFDAVLPAPAQRAECVGAFRAAPSAALQGLPDAFDLCLAGSGIPDACFVEPATPGCAAVFAAVGQAVGDPNFSQTFTEQLRLGCFQLGSQLQGGLASGSCFPEGLREREQMESFVMAFDTNLKPSVGQQVTVRGVGARLEGDAEQVRVVLQSAERRHCDATLFAAGRGHVVTRPNAATPGASEVESATGVRSTIEQLGRAGAPMTLTCYPPQADRAEARRVAFAARP